MEPSDRPSPSKGRTSDHLANERTFLAWVRTALGLIGLGFVLARMGLFLSQIAPETVARSARGARAGHEFVETGLVFLVLGTALSAWSGWVYFRTRAAIASDRYQPAREAVLALTAIMVLGGAAIVGLVVWRAWGAGP
jgi:putative membrane protein